MAAARQGLPVRLDRAPQRGAAFAIARASRRVSTRSIGSRSRTTGSLLIFDHPPAVTPPTQRAQIADRKLCRPHALPFRLLFARVVALFPLHSFPTRRSSDLPRPSTLAAVNLAPAVRHGCRSAGLGCPLGSSTAAGSSVRL